MKLLNKNRIFLSLILVFLSLIFLECSISRAAKKPVIEIVDRSSDRKPLWITRIPKEDEDFFYFRGIRTGAKTHEDGLTDSKMHAVRQIVDFLGQKGITRYEQLRETFDRGEEITVRDKVKFKGVGVVKGAKEVESYYEKLEYWEREKIINKYNIYILVTYPKEEYQREKIRQKEEEKRRKEEERRKKEEILTLYGRGLKSLKREMVASALELLQNSRKKLQEYFPDSAGIEIDSKNKINMATIETEIKNIIQKIELKPKDERIAYNLNGRVNKNPTIFVNYISGDKQIPVFNLTIKASFVNEEDGEIASYPLKTKRAGDIQIPVKYVNPSSVEPTIQCEVDLEAIGLEKEFTLSPYRRIPLEKTRSIAYSIILFTNGRSVSPQPLIYSIKSILLDSGYDIVEADIKKQEISEQEIKTLNLNVDYLVLVRVIAEGGEVEGMYYSKATSKASVYSITESRWVFMIDGPSATGYGTTLSNAGLDAVKIMKSELTNELKTMVKELK